MHRRLKHITRFHVVMFLYLIMIGTLFSGVSMYTSKIFTSTASTVSAQEKETVHDQLIKLQTADALQIYRLSQLELDIKKLEVSVKDIDKEHTKLLTILIINLVSVIVSMAIYLFTHLSAKKSSK